MFRLSVYFILVLHCAVGHVIDLECVDTVCDRSMALFTCRITGKALEWRDSKQSLDAIQFTENQPVGTSVQTEPITATLVSRNATEITSILWFSINTNRLNNGRTSDIAITCRDLSANNNEVRTCPSLTVLSLPPENPLSPVGLTLGSSHGNRATIAWSPPFTGDTEVIIQYIVTVEPSPSRGHCAKNSFSLSAAAVCSVASKGSTCRLTITHLEYDRSYAFTVQSVNCRGESKPTGPLIAVINNLNSTLARTVVDVATNTSKSFSCLFPSHKTTLVGPTQLGMTQQMPNMMTSVVTVNPDYTILKTQMPSPTGIMINKKYSTNSLVHPQTMAITTNSLPKTPVVTRSPNIITQGSEGLPVHWIVVSLLAAVIVVLLIIVTSVITCLIVWCSVNRRQLDQQKKDPIQISSSNKASINSAVRESDIYTKPSNWNRNSCSSMVYNQVYQGSFVVTINEAYSSLSTEYSNNYFN